MALKPWTLANVTANTVTDLVEPAANKEVAVVGLIICNTGSASADVVVTLTNSAGVTKATLLKQTLVPGESLHMDTKVFIAAGATPDKVRVLSTLAATSFCASGDES